MHNKVNKFECEPWYKSEHSLYDMGTPITKMKCKYCPTAECQATQLLVLVNNDILTQLIYYVSVLVRLAPQSTTKILVNYLYSKISGSYLAWDLLLLFQNPFRPLDIQATVFEQKQPWLLLLKEWRTRLSKITRRWEPVILEYVKFQDNSWHHTPQSNV